jgi:hypothetical protein
MKKSNEIESGIDPLELDLHLINLNESFSNLHEVSKKEQEFGLTFLRELNSELGRQEILQISATPEAIFCLAVKAYRKMKI